MRLTTPSPAAQPGVATASRETLHGLELFADLPDAELDQLTQVLTLSSARPGSILETQDAPVRHWHLVVSGHAVVERDATPIGLLAAGDSWCEHSLLNGMRSSISVIALSPVTVLSANHEQFFALPDDHPLLAGRLVARSASSPDRMALPVLNALIHMAQYGA